MTPSRRRPVVEYLHETYRVSERRACHVARIPVSTFRYESMQEPRTALRLRIREIAQTRVRYGYRKIRVLLNREGWEVGKKLVYRLYREEGLTLRHTPRKRHRAVQHRREGPGSIYGPGPCCSDFSVLALRKDCVHISGLDEGRHPRALMESALVCLEQVIGL